MGFKYIEEKFPSVSAAQCWRDEYTGPWSGNKDSGVSGIDGLYYIAMTRCCERNCGD
jgi:hypothetical protein